MVKLLERMDNIMTSLSASVDLLAAQCAAYDAAVLHAKSTRGSIEKSGHCVSESTLRVPTEVTLGHRFHEFTAGMGSMAAAATEAADNFNKCTDVATKENGLALTRMIDELSHRGTALCRFILKEPLSLSEEESTSADAGADLALELASPSSPAHRALLEEGFPAALDTVPHSKCRHFPQDHHTEDHQAVKVRKRD